MIRLNEVTAEYRLKKQCVTALKRVTLHIESGRFVAVTGPSGSGKTSMIQLVAGLLSPTAGDVIVSGRNLRDMDDEQMASFRNRMIGFVFQFFNLPSYYSALDNVALPLVFSGVSESERREKARQLLDKFDLSHRAGHTPDRMSGGEAQRVAIARALIANPQIILADEPTGDLDRETGIHVMEILRRVNQEQGMTVVVVTHDEKVTAFADEVIRIEKGELVDCDSRA